MIKGLLIAGGIGAVAWYFMRPPTAQNLQRVRDLANINLDNFGLNLENSGSIYSGADQGVLPYGVTNEDVRRTQEALNDGTYDPYWTNYDPNRYGFGATQDLYKPGIVAEL